MSENNLPAAPEHPLFETVVRGGYCIGCGGCAVGETGIRIAENGEGFLQPVAGPEGVRDEPAPLIELCPMSGAGEDETTLATPLFGADCEWDARIGHHHATFVGHVADRDDRERGSSGGLTTWLLRRLLERGVVDHVVHVLPSLPVAPDGKAPLFAFGISSDPAALDRGRKSTYYPVEMSAVIDQILARPGRYAITAVPCFAKALRLRALRDPVLRERVTLVVGTVCGHLKSRYFAEYLAWNQGVAPDALATIDFRTKLPEHPASDYGFTPNGDRARTALTKDLYAANWEVSFFRYDACEFCDDVFAETADIVFGDAWISPYDQDWLGNNVVVSRTPALTALLREGRDAGALDLSDASIDAVAQSQIGGLRHRREGLSVRLAAKDRRGLWRPRKRVAPDTGQVDAARADLYLRRSELSRQSISAFRRARRLRSLSLFKLLISGPVFRYYQVRYGLKRALRESVPAKALRKSLRQIR